jgi:prepilin-type N-terminal cleavage/methylation domain-containing protein
MKSRRLSIQGFTLVEMMIVVAIIGLLPTIAIPNFVRARGASQKSACMNNLRQIDGAIQQWALENRSGPDDPPCDIPTVLGYLKSEVLCPAAGTSTFGDSYALPARVSDKPLCKVVAASHVFPSDTSN